jgi:hypothetical protein
LKIRLKGKGGTTSDSNAWYVVWDPAGSAEKTYVIKKMNVNWTDSCFSETITLTKTSTATSFTIPEFWFVNTGQNDMQTDGDYAGKFQWEHVLSNGTRIYPWQTLREWCSPTKINGIYRDRCGFTTYIKSAIITKNTAGLVVTPGGKPTISFKDNGNNMVTISVTTGSNGDYNKLQSGSILYYTTNGVTPTPNAYNGTIPLGTAEKTTITKDVAISSKNAIKAIAYCKYKYNTADSGVKTSSNAFYAPPTIESGNPKLIYKKSRLTVREQWKFDWSEVKIKPANDDSQVAGYRMRLYKNGNAVPNTIHILDIDNNGKRLSNESKSSDGTIDIFYDRDGKDNTSIIIDPSITLDRLNVKFKAKDKVGLLIHPYAVDKNGKKYFKSGKAGDGASTYSGLLEIQNAGVVRVKVNNEWKEGQVYVKVAGAWEEAETVNVKVGGAWKESQ